MLALSLTGDERRSARARDRLPFRRHRDRLWRNAPRPHPRPAGPRGDVGRPRARTASAADEARGERGALPHGAPVERTSSSTGSGTRSCRTSAEVKEVFEELKPPSTRTSCSPTRATTCTRITASRASSPGTPFATTSSSSTRCRSTTAISGRRTCSCPSPRARRGEGSSSLLEAFPTQAEKHWFDAEVFLGLMRLRGMESRSPSGFAEAFTCRKLSVTIA